MRKLLCSLMFAVAAIAGNAQTTYNVRMGLGGVRDFYHDYAEICAIFIEAFQANIPVNTNKTLTVSPTLSYAWSGDCGSFLSVPVHLGYKIGLGHKSILFPKVGPLLAYECDAKEILCGFSTELAWEYKHFVIATNYFYIKESPVNVDSSGFHLTFGYKF